MKIVNMILWAKCGAVRAGAGRYGVAEKRALCCIALTAQADLSTSPILISSRRGTTPARTLPSDRAAHRLSGRYCALQSPSASDFGIKPLYSCLGLFI